MNYELEISREDMLLIHVIIGRYVGNTKDIQSIYNKLDKLFPDREITTMGDKCFSFATEYPTIFAFNNRP